jgi:hypothetical protein
MMKEYDSSWDTRNNRDKFEIKYEEWEQRNWNAWLQENLSFPFEVERMEDMEENPFEVNDGPFAVGHCMKALALDEEDDEYGFLIRVKDGKKEGLVPLEDVEVTSRKDPNFWPVREYVVWMANH